MLHCAGVAALPIWFFEHPDWNAGNSQRSILLRHATSPPHTLSYKVRKDIESMGAATTIKGPGAGSI
ncbi:hypothetical protein T10_4751 [Trichinella papuae]|uniref:Uncharacterized protein n=1 Tax=Trichinella papuae TaxID=268474 RepID=A0A0V1M9X2_9BILA|nr:hypothetical protein T10_4751 [Trichinella papuae]